MQWVLLVLTLSEFACAIYYKRRCTILEEGFVKLAKMAYNVSTKEQCERLASKLCEEIVNEHKRTNKRNI